MRNRLTVIATCVFLSAGLVGAAELSGVTMPDRVSAGGQELVLNGMGLRTKFVFKVYVAGLYLESASGDAEQILASQQVKRIEMHFLYKKVSQNKIAGGWEEGLKANSGDRFDAYREALDRLNGWMEEMVAGDTMIFTAVPGAGLEVIVKDRVKGVIEDEAFARDFWSIWLGPKPPNAGLKTGLLGQG
jgi:hypothetical protein